MEIGGVDLEAVHCCYELFGDVSALADAADDKLAFVAFEARDC